jgi:GNAT superfamily N-acetyltransferase
MTYLKAAIEPATEGDVPVMYGLAQDEIGRGFAPEHALEVLDSCEVFVARVEDVSCGYVAVDAAADAAVVRQLFVGPSAQNASIGNQLLDWVEGLAISRGLTRVEVESGPDNERAERFYRRRGYTRVDEALLVRELPGA